MLQKEQIGENKSKISTMFNFHMQLDSPKFRPLNEQNIALYSQVVTKKDTSLLENNKSTDH
jgi:hypothetical protein